MKRSRSSSQPHITEIFSSIQGEGLRMGERHLFIRFRDCHLKCPYCDEAGKNGRRMPLEKVLDEVDRLEKEKGPHAFISLTGGEPLLHAHFLKRLCRELKKKKYRILLETNGILWTELRKVIGFCDLVSMDLKLSSVSSGKDFLEEHRKFLTIAQAKTVYLKIPVAKGIDLPEYDAHLCMVAAVAAETPIFLQPVSRKWEGYRDRGLMDLINKLQRFGVRRWLDVRVGVQLHKILNIP